MLSFVAFSLCLVSLSGTFARPDGPYDVVLDRNNQQCHEVDPSKLEFQLYTRENPHQYEKLEFRDDGESVRNSSYNARRETKILVHSWAQSEHNLKNFLLQDYLSTQDVNVIVVNWSEYAKVCTLNSTRDYVVRDVARYINMMIRQLHAYGMEPKTNLHMIAYGVAAHIAGYTARLMHPLRMARITALDPTGLLFRKPGSYMLHNGDAYFIDAIYTSLYVVSADELVADVAFYPNGGYHPQPGLSKDDDALISSWDSVEIFKKSIIESMESHLCDSHFKWATGACTHTTTARVGEYVDRETTRGRYYFNVDLIRPLQSVESIVE